MRKKRTTIKPIYKNVLLLIVTIIVMLLLLEIFVRIFMPQVTYSSAKRSSPQFYAKSDFIPWTLKPNSQDQHIGVYGDFNVTVKVNSYGLRDDEVDLSENLKTILVLGDSFTFGYGVENNETYSQYLENMLNKNGKKYRVLNAGFTSGLSPDSTYSYLKNYGLETFKPDIIIIGFCVINDIPDIALNDWLELDEHGLPIKISSSHYSVDDKNRLRSSRRSLVLLKNLFFKNLYEFMLSKSHLFVFIKKSAANVVGISSQNRIFDKELNPFLEEYWNIAQEVYLGLDNLAKENNAELVIAAFPIKNQIHDNLWQKYERQLGKDSIIRNNPNNLMVNFGNSNNIKVVDTYDAFMEKNQNLEENKSLFLEMDGHFSKHGHELVAEQIHDYLLEQNLIYLPLLPN